MSKQQVSVFMGGTGANTASAALTNLGAAPVAAYAQANAAYSAANNAVLKAGDTMTGNLTMTGTQPAIRLQESGSGGDKRLQLSVNSTGVAIISADQSAQEMTFTTVGSERIRITSGGNVGVGLTNPSYKLDISGGIAISAKSLVGTSGYFICGSNGFRWNNSTDAFNNVVMYDNGNMYVRGNLGFGTTSPSYKVHIQEGGITAAAISTGWPSYGAESAAQSKYVLYLDAGGNGGTATAGQGASATLLIGSYYDARGIITMAGAGGSSPSDVATGYGKDLMVKGGNSDNTNGYVGGRLFLAGGSGFSGGAFGSNYGAVVLQPQGGGVGIGITNPGTSTKLFVNGQSTLKRLQKQVYNWYTTSGSSYVHFKTTLKLSGTGAHVGMWSWRFYGYSYGTAKIIDSYFGLHGDSSGNIYSAAYQDQGEVAFCTNMYKSSDNFLVIVGLIDNTYFFGLDVDVHHTMDYSYMELGISAVSQSASTSGVY